MNPQQSPLFFKVFSRCPFAKCLNKDEKLYNEESVVRHLISEHELPWIRMDEDSVEECRIDLVFKKEPYSYINVSCILEYRGLFFLLCGSWEKKFECWIYKLEEESEVFGEGFKLEWEMKLKSVVEFSENRDKVATKESVFPVTTSPVEIIEGMTGLSTHFGEMADFHMYELDNEENSHCIVKVAVKKDKEIKQEPEPEAAEENNGTKKSGFKCPNCSRCVLTIKCLSSNAAMNESPSPRPSESVPAVATSTSVEAEIPQMIDVDAEIVQLFEDCGIAFTDEDRVVWETLRNSVVHYPNIERMMPSYRRYIQLQLPTNN